MKKVLLVACVALFAAFVFAGCNQEEIKKLNDQVASLTTANQTCNAKAADLGKAKVDLQNQVTAANASLDNTKKDLDACKAAAESKVKGKKGAKAAPAAKAAPKAKAPKAKKAAAPAAPAAK